MRLIALAPLLLAGCWSVDLPSLEQDIYPFLPDVGAPDDWSVHRVQTSLLCPGSTAAPLFFVAPDAMDPEVDPASPLVPLAIIFTSGAFDYVPQSTSTQTDAAHNATTWQASQGHGDRLDVQWAANRSFELLGLRSNTDTFEHHHGNLPAALAQKGIASLIVPNCWGDLWHNRTGLAENDFTNDLFYRDGRTLAEFAWHYAMGPFPPGNPARLPLKVDTSRVYLIGLGDGSRAIAELLSLRDAQGTFLYHAAGAVFDSPEDDIRGYYNPAKAADYRVLSVRTGLQRIYPSTSNGPPAETLSGSLLQTPAGNFPARLGFILPQGDSTILEGTNDGLIARLPTLTGHDIWTYSPAANAHVLSNANPGLAKAVANFLASGLSGVEPAYVDP